MKSSDPYRACVNAEISIYDAIDAIEHFAENFPAERISADGALRVINAGIRMHARASFNVKDAESGRTQSLVPNQANTPQSMASVECTLCWELDGSRMCMHPARHRGDFMPERVVRYDIPKEEHRLSPGLMRGKTVVPECAKCFDEDGSLACVRPAHKTTVDEALKVFESVAQQRRIETNIFKPEPTVSETLDAHMRSERALDKLRALACHRDTLPKQELV